MLPIVICACIVMLSPWCRGMLPPLWNRLLGFFLPIAICAACLILAAPRTASAIVRDAAYFVTGRFSIDDAYVHQPGWNGRKAWGGIFPGVREPYAIVGPGRRIWTFNLHAYCMLPKCKMDSFTSVNMSPDYDRVLVGPPEEARDILQRAGLNYFLYSTSSDLGVQDILGHAPLFIPDNIANYLGIRWTDGTTYLLTWLGPDTTPLDESWLAAYRAARSHEPLDGLRQFSEKVRQAPRPLRARDIPL